MPPKRVKRQKKADVEDEDYIHARNAKHRNAAKSRRDQEAEEFAHLASLLPFPADALSRLDKSTILRLTISYLQTRHLASKNNLKGDDALQSPGLDEGSWMLESMEGFFIMVSQEGRILYVSDQIAQVLGYQPFEVIGADLSDFVPEFHYNTFTSQFKTKKEHKEQENITGNGWLPPGVELKRNFVIGMKYKVVNNSNKTKQTGYFSIQWAGRLQMLDVGGRKQVPVSRLVMAAVCRPTISVSLTDIPLYERSFILRFGQAFKCTYCDPRITDLMGFQPSEIVGDNLFEYYHPDDFERKKGCMLNTWEYGFSRVLLFRMINKMGRYVWIRTNCLMVFGPKGEPLFSVGLHVILSEKEGRDLAKQRPDGTLILGKGANYKEPFTIGNWETILKEKFIWEFPDEVQEKVLFGLVDEKRKKLLASLGCSQDADESNVPSRETQKMSSTEESQQLSSSEISKSLPTPQTLPPSPTQQNDHVTILQVDSFQHETSHISCSSNDDKYTNGAESVGLSMSSSNSPQHMNEEIMSDLVTTLPDDLSNIQLEASLFDADGDANMEDIIDHFLQSSSPDHHPADITSSLVMEEFQSENALDVPMFFSSEDTPSKEIDIDITNLLPDKRPVFENTQSQDNSVTNCFQFKDSSLQQKLTLPSIPFEESHLTDITIHNSPDLLNESNSEDFNNLYFQDLLQSDNSLYPQSDPGTTELMPQSRNKIPLSSFPTVDDQKLDPLIF